MLHAGTTMGEDGSAAHTSRGGNTQGGPSSVIVRDRRPFAMDVLLGSRKMVTMFFEHADSCSPARHELSLRFGVLDY